MDSQHEPAKQDEQHNMELWRSEVNSSLRDITKSLAEASSIIGRLPTRAEVEVMLSQRVHVDVFHSEVKAMQEDIAALKASPGKVRDWLSTGISAGVGCFSLIMAGFSLVLSLLIAIHIIH